MDLSGVFTIVALVLGIVLLLPLIIGGVFVVVVVANRADPDPSGRRPALVYALGTSFITLFITLFASTAFVASLCRLIGPSHRAALGAESFIGIDQLGSSGAHRHALGDSVARAAVLSAIVAIIAGVVCWLHLRAAARASENARTVDPLARVRSSYVAAVSFVSVLLVVVATIVVIYDIFRGAAPGVFTASGRGGSVEVLRSMIPALYLALAAGAILLTHLRQAPPPFRPGVFGRWHGGPSATGAAAPATPAPVLEAPTEVISSPASPAPRKRAPRKSPPEA
jgi:hypothetical protein